MLEAHQGSLDRRVVVGVLLLSTLHSASHALSLEDRRKKIKTMDQKISEEALQRRSRSEALLRSEGVPINRHLPVSETEDEAKRRSKDEVALRAFCLLLVAVKGEGLEQPVVDRIVQDFRLREALTPKERAFIDVTAPSLHDRVQFSWRYEAAWVLLWALGYVSSLQKPTKTCDVQFAVRKMRDWGPVGFAASAKLRSLQEILDEVDLIYRYHWAVVEARVQGEPTPANLEPGVVLERHYALNWLIGYMDQEWDDITTDT